jgi:serine-type D-Ala-D-Ala carboxypeptidase/endopeptidase
VTIVPSESPGLAVPPGTVAAADGSDPHGFDRHVGFYRADVDFYPDFVLTISREGDHLFEQRAGRARYEIFPRNDREFFYGMIDARDFRITFVQDSQGRITGMVVHQGTRNSTPRERTKPRRNARQTSMPLRRLV